MNANNLDLVFAPVTRAQARLFGGLAGMLDRRGVGCRFAVPSGEVAVPISDDWRELVLIQEAPDVGQEGEVPAGPRLADPLIPPDIGAYDAWRGGWSPEQRAEAAAAAVRFWRVCLERWCPGAVVLWNGRDHVFVEAAAWAARNLDIDVICMELGPLRRAPMTVAISRGGINAAAQFRRPELLETALTPWEAERLADARARCRNGVRPEYGPRPFAFLPLQVDDDTQLYYYAPHFADQRAMLAAVVAALPDDLPLVVKVHPLADERRGPAAYAPLLRPIDRLAPPATNTLGLIAGADVVITNNSSAGIEAALLERPVVVLGIAHYRGRGFTHDYGGNDDLRPLLRAALRGATAAQNRARERYLYELLFHELVHVEQHPLRTALDDEEYERMAIGLWDLVQPRQLGSDWHPVFAEVHSLRESLRTAVQAVIQPGDQATLLVATRFAAACLPEFSQRRIAILEELSEADTLSGCEAHLLAPDLSAGQRAAAAVRLRAAGAHNVRDLTSALSRQPCLYQVRRFNQLPRPMRDALYRQSAYWDYYLAQSGLSPENTPQKNVQAELLAEWLQHGGPSEILEYGCGDGRILARLATAAKRSWRRLTGVDSSARMLDLARDRLSTAAGVTLLPADARRILPFDDESFDTTLTCGTLQHVPAKDLPAVSRELHRVTRTALVHWEVCETHQPSPGEHYTNADTSRTIHAQTFARFGPVQMQIRDVRPLTGQGSLLARYELRQPLLTVLTLHAVGTPPSACTSFDYRNMFVSPGQLLEILDGLLRQGYRFLTLRKALACVQGAAPLQHKAVVLTFDDGYASVFDVARPLLEARGIRAAVFIPTGYVGRPFAGNTRAGTGPALPTMTAEQIRALADAGWEIGAHSVTHGLFAGLSRADARRELAASKALLEELLEQPVSTFAFPYGEPGMAYTPEHVELARTSGYELALTMRPGFVAPGYAGLDWPRIGVGSDTTSESLLDDLATLHRTTNGWPAANEGCGVSLKERVRGVVQRCVETGIERITLYGAGRHTARLLQTTPLWPLHVLGIVDDNCNLRGGQRYGLPVYAPRDLPALAPDAVLISSDQYEEAIYERIAPLEARGIRVLRLYDGEE